MGNGIPMDKIKNLSLKKTILLYLCVSLICSFLLSALVGGIASEVQQQIWWKYVDQEQYIQAEAGENSNYTVRIPRPSASRMSRWDHQVSELCDFLETYSVLLISLAGSGGAVFLFYRNKLKPPIEELGRASKMIGENNLDFQVDYTNKDEMGQLCQEFERMRRQLVLNNQKLWRTIEEEKALRSAVSHDLRSPLSVLKGYLEMLEEFRKAGILDQEKEGEMLEASRKQVQRMDQFVDMMAKLNSLEQRVLKPGPVIAKELEQEIRQAFTALGRDKQLDFHISENAGDFLGDREVILEVAENLLSNACRYAEKVIEIELSVTSRELKIRVKDDGEGFQEDKEELTKAFYQQNIKDSLKHTGLGMYISRLYCEKHGGSLLLENDQAGGAVVTAIFRKLSH